MDSRIDLNKIRENFGCDNCKHADDGMWDDYCRICNMDYSPPSKYRPVKGSMQEKLYYDEYDRISFNDYIRYLITGR